MHDLRQGLVPGEVREVFAIADNRADKDPRTEDFSDDHIRQTYQIARPARLSFESGIPWTFDVACRACDIDIMQIRDKRFSVDLATRWRAIDENSRSVSPAPSSLQLPQPTPSST